MRSYKELKISTSLGTISGLEWQIDGSEEFPTIIALHGWLDNAASFIPIANLTRNIRIIALDLPGHGLSDHLLQPGFYNLHDYVLKISKAVDQLNLKNFIVLGHSLGAIISAHWALTDSRISRMIWLDAVGGLSRPQSEAGASWRNAITALNNLKPRKPSYKTFEDAVTARENSQLPVTRQSALLLCSRGLEHLENGRWTWRNDKALMLPTPVRLDETAIQDMLASISQPVLVILAKNGWPVTEPRVLDDRLKKLRFVEYSWIDGGHHFHMEENVGRLVEIVENELLENTE